MQVSLPSRTQVKSNRKASTKPAAPATAEAPAKRTCSCWNAGAGRWVLQLTYWHPRRSAEDQFYHLTAIPSDWGRAFEVRKLQADGGEVYHVNLTSDGPTCDCKGHLQHGHCKHAESLVALDGRGKLPTPPAAPAGPLHGGQDHVQARTAGVGAGVHHGRGRRPGAAAVATTGARACLPRTAPS
jgi:hypothetical protein